MKEIFDLISKICEQMQTNEQVNVSGKQKGLEVIFKIKDTKISKRLLIYLLNQVY